MFILPRCFFKALSCFSFCSHSMSVREKGQTIFVPFFRAGNRGAGVALLSQSLTGLSKGAISLLSSQTPKLPSGDPQHPWPGLAHGPGPRGGPVPTSNNLDNSSTSLSCRSFPVTQLGGRQRLHSHPAPWTPSAVLFPQDTDHCQTRPGLLGKGGEEKLSLPN